MASLRTALRLAPRAQFVRQWPTSRVAAQLVPRRYASVSPEKAMTKETADSAETVIPDEFVDEYMAAEPPAEPEHTPAPDPSPEEVGEDPGMNGGYPNPIDTKSHPIKRQHRDPYAEWWDPIEKRNYGEPVHEDNDILGVFSPDEYTHFKPGWGGVLFGTFVASVLGLCAVVYQFYPDQPAVSRTFNGGLEKELGGSLARAARASADEPAPLDRSVA